MVDTPHFQPGSFLEDTLEALSQHKRSVELVQWVGSADGKLAMSWEEFSAMAKSIRSTEYGYQSRRVIAEDLVVVGDDWWLRRVFQQSGGRAGENIEYWECCVMPKKISPGNIPSIRVPEGRLAPRTLAESKKALEKS